ncbi:MAG: hypothetical protein AVDCRST_MAG38-959 [uncultured Solirubrobacteraceae bacterium]|uniref:Uncharacterized protein n=1 Tax=uncultured Solirubrobacteraceae bacterium TaxID=1162706 RepID=A0A6J4R8C6_9ACTN|nr:MAG: hypothetical protein AVDCRST_MAG38-959 [uncultured Solirubrobacteraceae bacterium]
MSRRGDCDVLTLLDRIQRFRAEDPSRAPA